jgi:D-apionate oxidoisomerase
MGESFMKIALLGAGGKMGVRLATNLKGSRFDVAHVEISEAGQKRLKETLGFDCVPTDEALAGAKAVILAVPDTAIGAVARSIIDKLDPGTMVIALDAAAPFAGHLPVRDNITYFVTHPCHPPIFNDETDVAARRDHFGGVAAAQSIVSALMQGPDEAFALGEEIAKTIYQPILRSHRVTVDQMALLEPGLSETVCATLLVVMREAMEEVIRRGVDRVAARDFLLGHMNILAAVVMGEIDGVFSDACNKAIENGKPRLMQPDWLGVFEPAEIAESIRRIT